MKTKTVETKKPAVRKAKFESFPVNCAFDKMIDIAEIKPNPKNPNTHPQSQIELLAKIMKVQGWRAPVTVSTRSGFIVRGHGRLAAAKLLNLTQVPVDYQDYKTADLENADLLADNKIAELAQTDTDMLTEVFKSFHEDFDTTLAGFNEIEIAAILDSEDLAKSDPMNDQFPSVEEKTDLKHTCPRCGFQFDDSTKSEQNPDDEEEDDE